MSIPLVSVCMASFNHAPFIKEAIESVLSQTFTDWELVITDDGSIDNTRAVLNGIVDERVKIDVFLENRSACVALNHSIRRARGRFIAVLNSDDAWMPEKLAKQLSVMEEQPQTAAVFTLASVIDERGAKFPFDHPLERRFDQPNRDRAEWLRRLLFYGNCLCHPSVLVRSEVYSEVGLYDECMAQLPDRDMWIRICLHHDLYVIQEPLTCFRLLDNERNASGNRPEVHMRAATENMLIWLKMFRKWPNEMAALLSSKTACPVTDLEKPADALFAKLPANEGESLLRFGMQAAQIFWMYEQISASEDWQAYQTFINRTGTYDLFGIRAREATISQPFAPPKNKWWNLLGGS